MILDGLIVAQLQSGRAHSAWLLGTEDLIRPWEMDRISLTRGARWRALTPATVLRIDARLDSRNRQPQIIQSLLSRASTTCHWLLAHSLILGAPSVEERLLQLFKLWSGRWGKVTPKGISIDLPLTHNLLGQLCGAKRPTVTLALRSLAEQRLLTRSTRGRWLLHRDPTTNPNPLLQYAPAAPAPIRIDLTNGSQPRRLTSSSARGLDINR